MSVEMMDYCKYYLFWGQKPTTDTNSKISNLGY